MSETYYLKNRSIQTLIILKSIYLVILAFDIFFYKATLPLSISFAMFALALFPFVVSFIVKDWPENRIPYLINFIPFALLCFFSLIYLGHMYFFLFFLTLALVTLSFPINRKEYVTLSIAYCALCLYGISKMKMFHTPSISKQLMVDYSSVIIFFFIGFVIINGMILKEREKKEKQDALFTQLGKMVGFITHEIRGPLKKLKQDNTDTSVERYIDELDAIAKLTSSLGNSGIHNFDIFTFKLEELIKEVIDEVNTEMVNFGVEGDSSIEITTSYIHLKLSLKNLVTHMIDDLKSLSKINMSFSKGRIELHTQTQIDFKDSLKFLVAQNLLKDLDGDLKPSKTGVVLLFNDR